MPSPPSQNSSFPKPETKGSQVVVPQGDTLVLKHGDTFALLSRAGTIGAGSEQGLFVRGTRHLSLLQPELFGRALVTLSSWISHDNLLLRVEAMNAETEALERGILRFTREVLLREGRWIETLRVQNYGCQALDVPLRYCLGADFKDLFEVRGAQRARRGVTHPVAFTEETLRFSYDGLDGRRRVTKAGVNRSGAMQDRDGLVCPMRLAPGASHELDLILEAVVSSQTDTPPQEPGANTSREVSASLPRALASARSDLDRLRSQDCVPHFYDQRFDRWFCRSTWDLHMLSKENQSGLFPHAGVPWFSTPFGRDSILTALQVTWAMPGVARGVLGYLAEHQASTDDPSRDAEPGKILHEARDGEMAELGEIPFGRYYGSIDSTPLFLVLASEYYKLSGDRDFLHELVPHLDAALAWIERSGDLDGDGFVEYAQKADGGLAQQGWKDSHDSVFHAEGTAAQAPIALCEVQGYVYAGKRGVADLYESLGRNDRAEELRKEALDLREKFDRAFWCEDLGTYALALDGEKKPCRVRSSNPGHCLYTGIALPQRAQRLADSLLAPDMFSGWGVRTLSTREKRYNPLSYHNGSVWPHDTALIAAGLARYGRAADAARIFEGLLSLSEHMENHRLPELLRGIERSEENPPVAYPVACSPQAWAAAVPFLGFSASVGLEVDGLQKKLTLRHPVLPVDRVRLAGLSVGAVRVDLEILRTENDSVSARIIGEGHGVVIEVLQAHPQP